MMYRDLYAKAKRNAAESLCTVLQVQSRCGTAYERRRSVYGLQCRELFVRSNHMRGKNGVCQGNFRRESEFKQSLSSAKKERHGRAASAGSS